MKKAVVVFIICCVIAAFADNPHITALVELIDVALSAPADGDVLTFDVTAGKWKNKAPASEATQKIGKVSFLGQVVGQIPDTTILTAAKDGEFIVSMYVACPIQSQPPSGTLTIHAIWTDEFGIPIHDTDNMFGLQMGPQTNQPETSQAIFTIHAVAGTDIKLSTSSNGDHTSVCDVFADVAPLQ